MNDREVDELVFESEAMLRLVRLRWYAERAAFFVALAALAYWAVRLL